MRGGKSSVSFDRTGSGLLELISAIGLPQSKKERTFTAGVAPHVVPKAGFDLGAIQNLHPDARFTAFMAMFQRLAVW
ncbi:MAG: hypothetical protein BVN28_12175 [Nitrospira sp. ST-bin4]|nr:MAG: hypothetical protein BVN28_12175 [Nitrospira sp. ST-bin4]